MKGGAFERSGENPSGFRQNTSSARRPGSRQSSDERWNGYDRTAYHRFVPWRPFVVAGRLRLLRGNDRRGSPSKVAALDNLRQVVGVGVHVRAVHGCWSGMPSTVMSDANGIRGKPGKHI